MNNGREKAVQALCLLHLEKVGKQHSDEGIRDGGWEGKEEGPINEMASFKL